MMHATCVRAFLCVCVCVCVCVCAKLWIDCRCNQVTSESRLELEDKVGCATFCKKNPLHNHYHHHQVWQLLWPGNVSHTHRCMLSKKWEIGGGKEGGLTDVLKKTPSSLLEQLCLADARKRGLSWTRQGPFPNLWPCPHPPSFTSSSSSCSIFFSCLMKQATYTLGHLLSWFSGA